MMFCCPLWPGFAKCVYGLGVVCWFLCSGLVCLVFYVSLVVCSCFLLCFVNFWYKLSVFCVILYEYVVMGLWLLLNTVFWVGFWAIFFDFYFKTYCAKLKNKDFLCAICCILCFCLCVGLWEMFKDFYIIFDGLFCLFLNKNSALMFFGARNNNKNCCAFD